MKRLFFITFILFSFCLITSAQDEESFCPQIAIFSYPKPSIEPNNIGTFTAEIRGEVGKNLKYVWKVSGGKILAGQGTKSIQVFRETTDAQPIVLEILGLPENCSNEEVISFTAIDPLDLILVNRYEEATAEQEKAFIDDFFNELQKTAIAEGIISLKNDENLLEHLRFLNSYLIARNFDKTRISYAIFDEGQEQTEFWIVPPFQNIPGCKRCLIIKAEDFEKLKKLFNNKTKDKRENVKKN